MTRRQALQDLALALLLTLLAGLLTAVLAWALAPQFAPPLLVLAVFQGAVILGGIALLLRWRHQAWRTLGLVPLRVVDLGRMVLALLVLVAASGTLMLALQILDPGTAEEHSRRLLDVAGLLGGRLPFALVLLGVLFIGLYEELLARGLLLRRCLRLTGSVWAAVLLSSLLFGLGHAYQGPVGMVQTAVIGIVLARLTLYWGTLWPAILAHAAINGWTLALARMVQQGGTHPPWF